MVTRMPVGAKPNRPVAAPSAAPVPATPSVPAVLQSGALAGLEDRAKDIIVKSMQPLKIPVGGKLFRPGDQCFNFLVVKDGSVKVLVTTETGREIVLYRVKAGETCVLTSACLLSGAVYDAEGVAETDVDAVILPKPAFEDLLATSPRFRHFVFSSYGMRLHDLVALLQEITVKQVDKRLARHLVSGTAAGVIEKTHQELANDLNTAREVVSRLLQDFAERGWVETGRGSILVKDGKALEAFAAG